MEREIKYWYEDRGFKKNPFSLDPIDVNDVETTAFVDRLEAREQIMKFVQEDSGSVIIISEIGYGKSSIMNLAEKYAMNVGKNVLRIDPRNNKDKICFFKSLIKEIELKIVSPFSDGDIEIIKEFSTKGEEQDLQVVTKILKETFNENPSVLVMDDLDKILEFKKHIEIIKEILDLLPKNLQVITTGDINQIMSSRIIVSILYEIFDFPILLDEIDTIDKLKEFIYGRMEVYATNTQDLKFSDEIFKTLLDRTRGNLRESFRYFSALLKTGDYSKENLLDVMIKIDSMRLYVLDNTDKEILLSVAGNKKDIREIRETLKKKISPQIIRARLNELHQNCMVYKYKSKDGKQIIYEAPLTIEVMLKP